MTANKLSPEPSTESKFSYFQHGIHVKIMSISFKVREWQWKLMRVCCGVVCFATALLPLWSNIKTIIYSKPCQAVCFCFWKPFQWAIYLINRINTLALAKTMKSHVHYCPTTKVDTEPHPLEIINIKCQRVWLTFFSNRQSDSVKCFSANVYELLLQRER